MSRIMAQPLTPCPGEVAVMRRFDRSFCDMVNIFFAHFCSPPWAAQNRYRSKEQEYDYAICENRITTASSFWDAYICIYANKLQFEGGGNWSTIVYCCMLIKVTCSQLSVYSSVPSGTRSGTQYCVYTLAWLTWTFASIQWIALCAKPCFLQPSNYWWSTSKDMWRLIILN